VDKKKKLNYKKMEICNKMVIKEGIIKKVIVYGSYLINKKGVLS
jgi:hypothetical protein